MLEGPTMLAVACYSVNGALKAMLKRMDVFGVMVIALVTAIGGGTLRDLLLGRPIFWVHDPRFLYVGAAVAGAVVAASRVVRAPALTVTIADAVGLALFAVIGAHVAYATAAPAVTAVLTGAMTGFGGGIARDVLCGEVPRVLKRDIHATAAIAGAGSYILLRHLGARDVPTLIVAMAVVLLIRAIEIRRGMRLPLLRLSGRARRRPPRDDDAGREDAKPRRRIAHRRGHLS